MRQNIDNNTLNWVKEEIDETLKQARNALEEFVENTTDSTQLRFSYNYIHQVHGTLKMVELYGAALLTEEMEKLTKALMNEEISAKEETYEVLMLSIIQLPDYLEKIQSGLRDDPLILLPLLNDLRAARGADKLSEASLFHININTNVAVPVQKNSSDIDSQQLAKKLRHIFQVGLLGWYRNQDPQSNLQKLLECVNKLAAACTHEPVVRVWWVCGGLLEALLDGGLEHSVAMNKMLGQIDREVKRLIDEGEQALVDNATSDLLTNILYYVAQSSSNGERVTEIREKFQLQGSVTDHDSIQSARDSLGGPNIDLLNTVSAAVCEYLNQVKDALDLFVRSNNKDPADLKSQSELLQKIADTLGMLSLGVQRKLILDQDAILIEIIDGSLVADEKVFMKIAGELLNVEAALERLSKTSAGTEDEVLPKGAVGLHQSDLNEIHKTLLSEIAVNMSKIKDAIVAFIEAPWGYEHLSEAMSLFMEIRGATNIIDLKDIDKILSAISQYIDVELIKQRKQPDQNALDALADAIAGVECYLEAVPGKTAGTESMLGIAEQALAKLGYDVNAPLEDSKPSSLDQMSEAIDDQGLELETHEAEKIRLESMVGGGADSLALETPDSDATSLDADPVIASEVELGALDAELEHLEREAENESDTSIREDLETVELTDFAFGPTEQKDDLLNPEENYEPDDIVELDAELAGDVANEEFNSSDATNSEDLKEPEPAREFDAAAAKQLLEDVDDDILSIFVEEAQEELDAVGAMLPKWKKNVEDHASLNRIRRAFHTLKGSGRLVGATIIGEFAWSVENMLNRVLDGNLTAADKVVAVLEQTIQLVPKLIECIESGENSDAEIELLGQKATDLADNKLVDEIDITTDDQDTDSVEAIDIEHEVVISSTDDSTINPVFQEQVTLDVEPSLADGKLVESADFSDEDVMDPTLFEIFTKEANGHLSVIKEFIVDCENADLNYQVNDTLVRSLHTLHGSARMAGASGVAEISGLLEKYTKTAMGNENYLSKEGIQLLTKSVKLVETMLDTLNKPYTKPTGMDSLVERVQSLYDQELQVEESRLVEEAGGQFEETDLEVHEQANYDIELLEVFLEEGSEILDSSEATLQQLKLDPENLALVGQIQRELHTLKGGARMSGIVAIGDLSHSVESLLTDISDKKIPNSIEIVEALHQVLDRLYNMLELAQQKAVIHPAPELVDLIEGLRQGKTADESIEPPETLELSDSEIVEVDQNEIAENKVDQVKVEFPAAPVLKKAVVKPQETVDTSNQANEVKTASSGQDVVRVRADLLDNLVNFAGEVSIYRSRLEQQNSVFNSNLNEMGSTVSRLQEQLRKLDMETEAQILYRYEKEGVKKDDFDPLEMDRYSQVQELSRGLGESISDISSIKGLLDNLIRESDTLLLQQSRVNTDLQEGLMRTRMVPFSQVTTRLKRLVRQTATELGKKVDLEITGEQGEIDRTVLERITAPLEHMLRNAVSHGIESAKIRKKQKKPVTATLNIEISRQGSEVMLRLSDDGSGMDLSGIKKKAIDKGLMTAKSDMTDSDIIQFIMEPGFSTAKTVTQISGRGVGMDVVASEIKQLGGSLEIHSEAGKGTTFIVLLPLTMAVNHALLAEVCGESYAISLSGIEGIVRLSSDEIKKFELDNSLSYEYADHKYELKNLSTMLSADESSREQSNVIPLLLIRSGDHRIALQVDNLLGSREIVVKSVGMQISSVRGISGATILGDGSVILILDISALVRMTATQIADAKQQGLAARTETEEKATIMVVDDSITVRKVTTRLLDRHDLHSITAKDGVDAVALLEEHIPDVILLDIEMPRMDGFEFATYVKNNARFKHIPIIMITSRTGDKHRNRAMSIGVNGYLGKPYQEVDLLNRIRELLKGN